MTTDTDVLILGGGLAGLTLALQLRQQQPSLRVRVIERHRHPVREAAFKVGESTVEIGAYYFADVLGLREHLDSEQIRKFGFRFFFSEARQDLDRCTEIGVSRLLPTPSWQIDRGRFENFLGERVREAGADFLDGAVVRGIDLGSGDAPHTVRYERDGEAHTAQARWVIDAAGRAGLLKRKLDLAQPNTHNANAVWWRVDGHLQPNDWSTDHEWLTRCTPPDRWRSTNHMCGPGYWFWLIPLASGAHSVGIVCDGDMHPLDGMNTLDKAMDWLRTHQPRVAQMLEGRNVQDFLFMRHFSHGCKQVFGERWALTGEAGVFLDPFYSPGSDFIAISNTYICDLIARDMRGERAAPYAAIYQQLYFSFYENTLTLYQDQYPLFGDEQVMPLKVIWDYTYYWALLAPLFFAQRQCDLSTLSRLREPLQSGSALNAAMQPLLREWGRRNGREMRELSGRSLDQYRIGWFHELNRALNDTLDDEAFATRIRGNIALMRRLAVELMVQARSEHPEIELFGLDVLLAGLEPVDAEPLLSADWHGCAVVADPA